jgi:hypothetical protein
MLTIHPGLAILSIENADLSKRSGSEDVSTDQGPMNAIGVTQLLFLLDRAFAAFAAE